MGICLPQCSFLWKGINTCHKILILDVAGVLNLVQYVLACLAYRNNLIQVADEKEKLANVVQCITIKFDF